jgi:four helix bundle protein
VVDWIIRILAHLRLFEPVRKLPGHLFMNGATKHDELIAWQRANDLRALILRYTRGGSAAQDFEFRKQIRKAARSACYNTSEGFYRFRHGDFANFLVIAHGSLGECLDQIDDGCHCGYFSPAQHLEMKRMCLRAKKANTRLRQWLEDNPTP